MSCDIVFICVSNVEINFNQLSFLPPSHLLLSTLQSFLFSKRDILFNKLNPRLVWEGLLLVGSRNKQIQTRKIAKVVVLLSFPLVIHSQLSVNQKANHHWKTWQCYLSHSLHQQHPSFSYLPSNSEKWTQTKELSLCCQAKMTTT